MYIEAYYFRQNEISEYHYMNKLCLFTLFLEAPVAAIPVFLNQ